MGEGREARGGGESEEGEKGEAAGTAYAQGGAPQQVRGGSPTQHTPPSLTAPKHVGVGTHVL